MIEPNPIASGDQRDRHDYWPLLHVVIAIAGILLFQAEKRHYNFLIPIGASIPFLTGIAHILYFFPVVGMINNGDVGPETLGISFSTAVLLNRSHML